MLQAQTYSRPMPPVLIKNEVTSANKDWKKALRSARRSSSKRLEVDGSVEMKPVAEKEKKKEAKAVKAFHQATQKTSSMKERHQANEAPKATTKLSATAKNKFLDNLSRFQKDSKLLSTSTTSAFQRPSLKAQETNTRDNLRRSFRSASSQAPKDQSHFLRQSLRRTRNSEGVINFDRSKPPRNFVGRVNERVDKKSPVDETNSVKSNHAKASKRSPSDVSKVIPSNESSETQINTTESMTSSRASSASSGMVTSESLTSRPSSGLQRSLSRNEAAMEKHKERMRKASMTAPLPASTRQQITPKMKRRNQHPEGILADVKTTRTAKPRCSEVDRPDKTKKENLKSSSSKTSKTNPKSSMATWNSVNVIEVSSVDTFHGNRAEEVEAQNSFDLLDIRSPMIRKKNPIKSSRKQRASKNQERSFQRIAQQGGTNKHTPLEPIPAKKIIKETLHTEDRKLIATDLAPSVVVKSRKTSSSSVKTDKDALQLLGVTEANHQSNKKKHIKKTEEDMTHLRPLNSHTHQSDSIERSRKISTDLGLNQKFDHKTVGSEDVSTSRSHVDQNGVFPEEPLILNIPSTTSMLNVSDNSSSKSLIHNHEPRKSSRNGSSSETKETEKRTGVKKAKKDGRTAQLSIEKEKRSTIADRSVGRTNIEAVTSGTTSSPRPSESSFVEEKFDCSNLLSEKLILDLEVKPSPSKRASSAPTKHRVNSNMSVADSRAPVASRSFRLLSASQRREKLRRVLLKYRKDSDSDSPLSEGSGDDSDIDMKWLEDGENDSSSSFDNDAWINSSKPVVHDTPQPQAKCNGHVYSNGTETATEEEPSKQVSEDNEKPKIGSMKAMWENKTTEVETSSRSSPAVAELQEVRNKVGEAKARLLSQSSSSSLSINEQPEMQNGEANDDTAGPRNVGSMLSMWENRKAKQHSAYNATKDDAFDSGTMGRLKGAKALFANMSKKPNGEVTSPTRYNGTAKSSSAKHVNVKDIFETTSPSQEVERKPSVERQVPSPESPVEMIPSPTIKSHSSQTLEEGEVDSSKTSEEKGDSSKTSEENGDSPKTLADGKDEPVVESKAPPLESPLVTPRKSRDSSSSDWLEDDDDLSDVATLSSATTSEDEEEEPEIQNVRSMWERRASQKSMETSSNTRKKSTHEFDNVANGESEGPNVPNAWIEANAH